VLPGDRVPLTLVWRALEANPQNYALFVHAVTPDGLLAGQLDTFHGGGMLPTSQWGPGDTIIDTVHVPISLKAQGPTLLKFNVGLHEPPGPNRLPAFSSQGQSLDLVFAGETGLRPFEWPPVPTTTHLDAVFDNRILLADVEPLRLEARPGETVTVTVQWQALDQVNEDYVGFVHMVDEAGRDVAQDDHPPMDGRYPTRFWITGTVVTDPYVLRLPDELSPGDYSLRAGFYHPKTGQRLGAFARQSGERWKDDLVHIGSISVVDKGP
jgi:hypothetical protein